MGMSIDTYGGSLAKGEAVRCTASYSGEDVGAVRICGHPRNPAAAIQASEWGKGRDGDDRISYHATLTNTGSQATHFDVQGGKLKDHFVLSPAELVLTVAHGFENRVRVRVRCDEDRGAAFIGPAVMVRLPSNPPGTGVPITGPINVRTDEPSKKRHLDGSVSYGSTVWTLSKGTIRCWLEGGSTTNDPL